MSIAFNQPYAAADGNARRVYSRLLGLSAVKETDAAARLMVSRQRPGDYAQAVMELGSTICAPAAPACTNCPITHWCEARRTSCFNTLRRPRPKPKPLEWPLVFVEANGSVLLHKRPASGLLAGLWELPGPETLANRLGDLRAILRARTPVSVIRHAITDHRITAPVYVLQQHVHVEGPSWAWVRLSKLSSYPLSSLSVKAIRKARRMLNI